jgi:ABC-type multidrug transport system fused ATPase/permease subunit
MTTALQENLAGPRLLQAYRREERETARFREINQELFRRAMAAARERAIYLPTIFCLGTATGGVILRFGGSLVMAGSLTLGEFVAFIGYVGLLTRPLTTLGWMISLAQREVLVLGNPFSNVDAETEERLLETVRSAAQERLVLLITHRIKTLQAADRITVVADGRIVAEGAHRQLLAQGGLYRQLYERQCLREGLA